MICGSSLNPRLDHENVRQRKYVNYSAIKTKNQKLLCQNLQNHDSLTFLRSSRKSLPCLIKESLP